MKLNSNAEIYIPRLGKSAETNYLAVVAHHDDGEVLGLPGILSAICGKETAFSVCVVTDGAGSARSGAYADYTDLQMAKVRATEQKQVAEAGRYAGVYLLNYPSRAAYGAGKAALTEDIREIVRALRPKIIYTHNLCDSHKTHLAVAAAAIAALRGLPQNTLPEKLYGMEAWRSLDWLCAEDKIVFDVSAHRSVANALIGLYDSQIAGGKRYDIAVAARQSANATFLTATARTRPRR